MTVGGASLTINTGGLSFVVNITPAPGVPLFTDAALTAPAAFPATITVPTTWFMASGANVSNVSCVWNGVELFGKPVAVAGVGGSAIAPVPTLSQIAGATQSGTSGQNLTDWAQAGSYQLTSGTRDSNGALLTGTVLWPDGTSGVFTADVLSAAFPGAIDAYHVTWLGSPAKTVTQTAVTRDPATGAVTAQPALTVA